jgi:hypothetical protein
MKKFTNDTIIKLYKDHPVIVLNPNEKNKFMIGFSKANLILANVDKIAEYIRTYEDGKKPLVLDEYDYNALVLDYERCILIAKKFQAVKDFTYNSDEVILQLSGAEIPKKKVMQPGEIEELLKGMDVKNLFYDGKKKPEINKEENK